MNWKLEVVTIPVSDLDRAKGFYVDQIGSTWTSTTGSDEIRFIQLTPRDRLAPSTWGKGSRT